MIDRGPQRGIDDARLLLLVPVLTYVMSYLYLGIYHHRINLWTTVVHESGRYTLLENTFYASHFLGHLPVLITIALLFAGCWLTMTPRDSLGSPGGSPVVLVVLLALLLVVSAAISVVHFGGEDTLSFVLQRKQQPELYVEGGSWNLHLPSTMLQFLLIPAVVWLARRLFGRPVVWSGRGLGLLATAVAVAVATTWAANSHPLDAIWAVWRDPRYLAHAVRELATFPLTYYPLPLALMLSWEKLGPRRSTNLVGPDFAIGIAAVLFVVGFGYQVVISLANDVGALAQRPDFAKGGELSIAYLLASHYYEHVLDTFFFALLTLLLVAVPVREGQRRKT